MPVSSSMMLYVFPYSLTGLSFSFVLAGDLASDLRNASVESVFPGDVSYVSSSEACKALHHYYIQLIPS